MNRRRRRLVGLALIGTGFACITVLHLLHGLWADLAPWQHRLSEYANARAGVLMTAAFTCLGLALLTLAPVVVPMGRTMRAALRVGGVGLLLAGVFRTGVAEAGATADAMHGATSSTATVAMIGAVVLSRRRVLGAIAVLLGAVSPVAHGTVVAGLAQRLLWTVLLLWCVLAARSGRTDISALSARSETIDA